MISLICFPSFTYHLPWEQRVLNYVLKLVVNKISHFHKRKIGHISSQDS
jgi:hypothetical protein